MPSCPLKSCVAFQQWLTWSSASWPFPLDWLDPTTAPYWCSTSLTSTPTWSPKACYQRSWRKSSPHMKWWVVVVKSCSLYMHSSNNWKQKWYKQLKQITIIKNRRGRDQFVISVGKIFHIQLYKPKWILKILRNKSTDNDDLICRFFEVNVLFLSCLLMVI